MTCSVQVVLQAFSNLVDTSLLVGTKVKGTPSQNSATGQMVKGVMFLNVEGDIFYRCLDCKREFYDGGRAAHHEGCTHYRAGEHEGGTDNCIRVFGPDDIRAQDGGSGIWALAMAHPGEVITE